MEGLENVGNSTSQIAVSVDKNAVSSFDSDGTSDTNQAFPNNVKQYLERISSDVQTSSNPKLRKEHQRLADLLQSYERLSERLRKDYVKSCETNIESSSSELGGTKPKKIIPVLPEIYAILRPDLYKDIREEEKKHLITKFTSKRLYSQAERVFPPHTVPLTYVSQDRRQREKDRFCRLISTKPSKFHNIVESDPSTSKPSRLSKASTIKVENVREKEKDRLAKILASSTLKDFKTTTRTFAPVKTTLDTNRNNGIEDSLRHHFEQHAEEANELDTALNQENINPQLGITDSNMVKVGEYSPLNRNHQSKTMLGVSEHELQKERLIEERRREYKNMMAKQKSEKQEKKFVLSSRMSSASTQTDSEESSTSYQDESQGEFDSPVQSANSSPPQKRLSDISPREKLLFDLYGSPPLRQYQTVRVEKEKQIAYREALRAQIEEKKRLEEERRRREEEEEKLIEKRVQEQAEKLRIEYIKEQSRKYDWMLQKQEQEEALRKRLIELELESKELKRKERQRKLQKYKEEELGQIPGRQLLQNRASRVQDPLIQQYLSGHQYSEARSPYTKSPILLEVPPLLDCDRQNVLSSKAGELKRVSYNDNHEDIGALALGPGVNLLSPDYRTGEEGSSGTIKNVEKLTSKTKDTTNVLLEDEYLPTVGEISPKMPKHTADGWYQSGSWSSSNQSQQELNRPPSPVIPALQTDLILKRRSDLLDDKLKFTSSSNIDLNRTAKVKPLIEQSPNTNILTQLGEFRRKLALQHQLLEERLKHNS